MRGYRSLVGVLCGVVALGSAGCGSDVPTSVDDRRAYAGGSGAGATLSIQGSNAPGAFIYDRAESRELRRHLLTSVRADHPIARGRRQQVILRSFVVGTDSFHYALAYGERTGPPTHSVLVKNGKPIALVRYRWEKRGSEWRSEAAQMTFWNQRGVPVIAGAVRDERGVAREISAVVERVTFAILAHAVRPAEAQLFFQECFAEYMDLASAAAALAVLIAVPEPTALTKLLAITLASAYAKAVFKLNACIEKHLLEGGGPHEGDGGGTTPPGGGDDDDGSDGGGDPDLMALLRKLIEDCEAREEESCLYTF
ncbi:MAG TPA: hypothetical protein VJ672_01670 [Gemmatimonadaceae bacterium]|nr:hypothetical protein [Gemmatimonadaceae bacterium]